METSGGQKLKIAIIHPDLGIGGAERLIVDAAVELASHGHSVHVFTAHHDRNRCFEDTVGGPFPVTVYGGFDKRLKENVEYLEELKGLAESEGISDRVNFVTSCSTAERNVLLSECLCVLYTPKDEHFGIVPLEAMAAQKPVIACNSGGPVETVKHEITGFLCDPTPLEFSKSMAKLMADPEMAAKMGKEARHHVTEKFSTKTFGEQLNHYVLNTYHRRIE